MAKRILFVDDEEDMRFVINTLLKSAGYDVDLHADISFIEHIGNNDYPDLYLLDRHIDGTDLFDVCRTLKAHEHTRHIPVIMFSADPNIRQQYREAGADGCIEKPFDIDSFLNKIASFLK